MSCGGVKHSNSKLLYERTKENNNTKLFNNLNEENISRNGNVILPAHHTLQASSHSPRSRGSLHRTWAGLHRSSAILMMSEGWYDMCGFLFYFETFYIFIDDTVKIEKATTVMKTTNHLNSNTHNCTQLSKDGGYRLDVIMIKIWLTGIRKIQNAPETIHLKIIKTK